MTVAREGSVRGNLVETGRGGQWRRGTTKNIPFRRFKTSREIIRLAVVLHIRFPSSLLNGEEMQKFAAVHASVYNHFNQERSLSSRDIFKQNRAAALAEWRGLGLN